MHTHARRLRRAAALAAFAPLLAAPTALRAQVVEAQRLMGDPIPGLTAGELERFRAVLADWQRDCDPYRDIPESEMLRRWWPDGQQPTTGDVRVFALGEGELAQDPVEDGASYAKPVVFQLHSPTQGASIAWTTESGPADEVHWELYTSPLRLDPGTTTLRLRAIRLGYKESAETMLRVTID